MALDKLVQDMLYRFKRLIIPEMISPQDSYWGGEKQLVLNQKIEIARVRLDIPSFFTTEINIPNQGGLVGNPLDILVEIEIGIGRSTMVRSFNVNSLNSTTSPPGFLDPLFQLNWDAVALGAGGAGLTGGRIRFTVWGTMLKVTATALNAAAVQQWRTSVTPGAGPITSATLNGVGFNFMSQLNANSADREDVAQSAARVTLVPTGSITVTAGWSHGLSIYNDSMADLYIRETVDGVAATLTNFTRRIPPGVEWSMPGPPFFMPQTNPAINGIWAAAGPGAARITARRRA